MIRLVRASLLIVLATALTAQDGITSGPEPGTALPPLSVYASSGPDAGLEYDLAAAIGDGPGAILFVHEITRNVAPLLRGLDALGDSHRVLGLTTGAVVLAADRSEAERRVVATSQSLQMTRPLTVSVDGAEGPGPYALNRRCTLTLVLCKDGVVHDSVAFTDTGRQDLGRLTKLVEAVTGPLPESPGELRAAALASLPTDVAQLRARAAHLTLELHWAAQVKERARRQQEQRRTQQRGAERMASHDGAPDTGDARAPGRAARTRVGAPPQDSELQGLLRRAIRKTSADDAIDAVFGSIRTRVGDDEDLGRQAVEMFKLMLSLDYGGDHARELARTWLTDRGVEPPAPSPKREGDAKRGGERRDGDR